MRPRAAYLCHVRASYVRRAWPFRAFVGYRKIPGDWAWAVAMVVACCSVTSSWMFVIIVAVTLDICPGRSAVGGVLMETFQLPQLWAAAAVLAGFQLTALGWRIQREIYMESRRERTWLTLADIFVGVSFLLLLVGVFAGPILSDISSSTAAKFFGLALFCFAASPFVLAGHYYLYGSWCKKRPRPWVTVQEAVVASCACAFLVAYVITWAVFA